MRALLVAASKAQLALAGVWCCMGLCLVWLLLLSMLLLAQSVLGVCCPLRSLPLVGLLLSLPQLLLTRYERIFIEVGQR